MRMRLRGGDPLKPARLCPPPQRIVVSGGRRLDGVVPISGYKHALTVVVAAAVAMGKVATLRNVPITTESLVLERILSQMGARSRLAGGVWELDTRPMRNVPVPARLSRLVHGSLYLVPALLARFGEVSFSRAGGDRIGPPELGGARPTDQVGTVMERFGASVDLRGGLHASAGTLRGCRIDLMDFSTHPRRLRGPAASSATKTALLLAAVAEGPTTLRHPVDRDATWELCDFLRCCGATVTEAEDGWHVEPAAGPDTVQHHLISDSTEIATFVACVAHVGGSLRLTGITGARTRPAIADELRLMERIGVPLTVGDDWLEVSGPASLGAASLEVECNGFSTDAHPLLALVLLGARWPSDITDHVWTNRFAYARLLIEMGADIEIRGNTIQLRPSSLRAPPGPLRPTDSRAAAVAVVAGLGAAGTTAIADIGHLDRSYERLIPKLRAVGADITVIEAGDGL